MKINILRHIEFITLLLCIVACTNKGSQSKVDPDDTLPGRTVVELNPDSSPKVVYYYKIDDSGNLTDEKIREVHYRPGKKKYVAGDIKNDERNGEWKAYHENGRIQTEATYIDGKEHGEYKVYQDNGAYLFIGHYDHGICVGEWKKFNRQGEVIKTVIADSTTVVCGGCEKCKVLRKEKKLKYVTF